MVLKMITKKVITQVRCMDGRITEAINNHNRSFYEKTHGNDFIIDEISTAGAVKMITEKGFNRSILKSLQISIEGRLSREVNLYIHSNCGYYSIKDEDLEKKTQVDDARQAAIIILKKFKRYKLTINIWWVNLLNKDGTEVVIQKVI